MNEEIELLKYLKTNYKLHHDWLVKLLKEKETKDNVYEIIQGQISQSRKYVISLDRMIESRSKKQDKEANVILDMVTSLGATIVDVRTNDEYIKLLKESIKINIMDINRAREEYNIKSKTIHNLLTRIESNEKNNLLKLDNI